MAPHVIEIEWLGERIRTFRDLIPPRPRALLVGLNPSPVSLDAGHYHQGRLGKRMWRRLERARIIPPPPTGRRHDDWLSELGFGLTDIVKRPSPTSRDLTADDYAHGRARLLSVIQNHEPPLVCFIYKRAAEEAIGARLPAGAGLLSDHLCGARVFVLPGPRAADADVSRVLRRLRLLLAELPGPGQARVSS